MLTNTEFEELQLTTNGHTELNGDTASRSGDPKMSGGRQVVPEVITYRKCTLVFGVCHGFDISEIFKNLENNSVSLNHVETRQSKKKDISLEFFLTFEGMSNDVINVVKSLKQNSATHDVNILSESDGCTPPEQAPWFPHHISDLDRWQTILEEYEVKKDPNYPGIADLKYRDRKEDIVKKASEYRYGHPIPRIEYNADEIKIWRTQYKKLTELYKRYACKEYNDNLSLLEKECGYCKDTIPQLEDVSNFLKRRTGFTLRPVGGQLTPSHFMAGLAHRVFHCTQYVRHGSKIEYSEEPDVIHELLGHAPMLADPLFAEFLQGIGLASIGISDADCKKFFSLLWYTLEVGLCKQNGQMRAFGAALLSSSGELVHSLSDTANKMSFEPEVVSVLTFDYEHFQPKYFVTESLEDMKEKLRRFCASLRRPHEMIYDSVTQTIKALDTKDVLMGILRSIQADMSIVQTAIQNSGNLLNNVK